MRYSQASATDFRALPLKIIAHRYVLFVETHKQEIKFRMALAGVKTRGL